MGEGAKSTRAVAQGPELMASHHRLSSRESGRQTVASGTNLSVLPPPRVRTPKESVCDLQARAQPAPHHRQNKNVPAAALPGGLVGGMEGRRAKRESTDC